ncbi:hypothetical protein HK099_002200, partial [Clydaea vesicula]
ETFKTSPNPEPERNNNAVYDFCVAGCEYELSEYLNRDSGKWLMVHYEHEMDSTLFFQLKSAQL